MLIVHKVFFKRCYGNMSRIRDLIDVLGLPHLVSRNLCIYNKSQGALHSYLPSLGGANAATPHYPTVELRVFGGLGSLNHFEIIFDSGPDQRSKIQDSWERLLGNLGLDLGSGPESTIISKGFG